MSTDASTPVAGVFRRLLTAAAVTAAAAACTSVHPTAATFEGTSWQVSAINGRPTPGGGDYQIRFEGGRVGGRFGCNQFGGRYRVQADLLIVTEVASNLMGCAEPAASFEAQGFAVLRQPMRMSWSSANRLSLANSAGSIALERATLP